MSRFIGAAVTILTLASCAHFLQLVATPDEPGWDCDVICQTATRSVFDNVVSGEIDARYCRCFSGNELPPFLGFGISMNEQGLALCAPDVHTVSEQIRAAEKAKGKLGKTFVHRSASADGGARRDGGAK